MKTEIFSGYDKEICAWVGNILKIPNFEPCTTFGIVKSDKLICGVVFNNFCRNYLGQPISIEASIASVDNSWATRYNLNKLFAYPFIQLGVKRLQTTCPADDPKINSINQRLGFQLDGIAREAWHLGGNAAVYSMLKHECKWIDNGKTRTFSTRPVRRSLSTDRAEYPDRHC